MNQGNGDLRDYQELADDAVNDVEHFWNPFTRVITDIDSRGEGSLTGALNYQNVDGDLLGARRQYRVELPQQRKVQNVQGRAVDRDANQPFLLFYRYAHYSPISRDQAGFFQV